MRSPLITALATFLLAGALSVGETRAAGPAGTSTVDPAAFTKLSDEQTLSRWANPEAESTVRLYPARGARKVGRLRFDTEDGVSEVYLALREYTDPSGRVWTEVRLPARPNGQKGWVPRAALGKYRVVRSLLRIDRRSKRAKLVHRGKVIWRARVGVGKPSTPTPAGRFYVRERLIPADGTIYGKLAFGLSAYARVSEWPGGGVVGVHGTNRPALIPGSPSSGCIRLRAADLRRLGRLLEIGTPVWIT
jgi:lipoprotein-anchoring transpeptidase ErfK/SrfK